MVTGCGIAPEVQSRPPSAQAGPLPWTRASPRRASRNSRLADPIGDFAQDEKISAGGLPATAMGFAVGPEVRDRIGDDMNLWPDRQQAGDRVADAHFRVDAVDNHIFEEWEDSA